MPNNNRELGLLRLTDFGHQDDIKTEVAAALEDLYDALGQAREDTRALEDAINAALYGTGVEERSHYRSIRCKMLDPRG
jgi:hypothetical protein